MSASPRRWYVVVSQALLEAADQYQQCRQHTASAISALPAPCAAPTS